MSSVQIDERPPSLLDKRPIEAGTVVLGLVAVLAAHVVFPLLVVASQWLLVYLGLALAPEDKARTTVPDNVIAAEFVRLGKPFDPTKLPSRKVPPKAKRRPDGVVVSKDPREQVEKPEEKKEKTEAETSMLDNLVDRTKEFAEDVEYEQEGDPNGLREGTATSAREGDIYRGQLKLFFQRGWTVPNTLSNTDKLVAIVKVRTADDGQLEAVELTTSSGDPLFDQSGLDAVEALIRARAVLPEPPADQRDVWYGNSFGVRYDGKELRR